MSFKRQVIALCGIILIVEGARKCPESSKAHLTRCDMYFKCVTLPSNNIVWVPKNCPNGLVYNINYKSCVLPDNDWECQLDENDISSSSSSDENNKYGVSSQLSYLRKQIKGYEAENNRLKSDEEEQDGDEKDDDNELSDDGFLITLIPEQRKNDSENIEYNFNKMSNNSIGNEFESSGDGEDEENLENKAAYIPIPVNTDPNGVVTAQLQRLSQLIKNVNNEQNPSNDLAPDELNQFLALHKITFDHGQNHNQQLITTAEPIPNNGLIDDNHLEQILELQKKINAFAVVHSKYSTPATPVELAISGNGAYPADATTVHIKATNKIKNPILPASDYSSSQIVVNRPGGSVIFLPQQQTKKPDQKKAEPQISEQTLKLLLELSKQMSNHAPNTPNFVHSAQPTTAYAVQPVIQPILYNIPWHEFPFESLLNLKKQNEYHSEDESMEKMSAVSGIVQTTANTASEPDDKGQSTIIHNHIPITIAHPNPTDSIIDRIHSIPTITTTHRPVHHNYDSYGHQKPSEMTGSNDYISYPPFLENTNDHTLNSHQVPTATSISYSSPYSSAFHSSNYNPNVEQQPQYIQISQSRPDSPYISTYSENAVVSNAQKPIPTYASIGGGYTHKFHTPSPHLNNNNVNDFVHIDRKPYPTLQPINYVPIASASSPAPNYENAPEAVIHSISQKFTITDKVDHFSNSAESIENEIDLQQQQQQNGYGESDENNGYTNQNVEQNIIEQSNHNVMNLLANYNSQVKPNLLHGVSGIGSSAEKKPLYSFKPKPNENHKQFVNLNGNFMSLETYQQTIEPYLSSSSMLQSQIEVLTCATGVRQANSSDCTRYFVCNAKTGKILSYSCPMYTAFNPDTKICNAETYSRCYPDSTKTKFTQLQLQQSLIEANRIKTEALKAQQLAHLITVETDKFLNANKRLNIATRSPYVGKATSSMPLMSMSSLNSMAVRPYQRPQQKIVTNSVIPTIAPPKKQQPHPLNSNNQTSIKKIQGKRKIPCRTEDPNGTMRARRLQCPANLTFCSIKLICTEAHRCMDQYNRL